MGGWIAFPRLEFPRMEHISAQRMILDNINSYAFSLILEKYAPTYDLMDIIAQDKVKLFLLFFK